MSRKSPSKNLLKLLRQAIRTESKQDARFDNEEDELPFAVRDGLVPPPKGQIALPPAPGFGPQMDSVRAWRQHFTDLLTMFPKGVTTSGQRYSDDSFSIKGVYRNRLITAEFRSDQGVTCVLYAGRDMPPAACSCRDSDGKYACGHCYSFMRLIIDRLSDETSDLAERVRRQKFDTGSLNFDDFCFDTVLESLRDLSRFMRPGDVPNSHDLPRLAEVRRERVAWSFSENSRGSCVLEAMIQRLNKRGDAWNKGRSIAIGAIGGTAEMTTQDEAAVRIYKSSLDYLGRTEKVVETLNALVGQSNVYFASETCEVMVGNASLQLGEFEGGWAVRPVPETGQSAAAFEFFRDGVINIDDYRNRIYVSPVSTSQLRCMQALLGMEPVKKPQHVEVLKQHCRDLQKIISLKLPDDLGDIEENPCTPVLLFRSRTDGYLEYGMRVRDSQGQLATPGVGTMYSSKTDSSKTDSSKTESRSKTESSGAPAARLVQLRRSFANELAMIRKLQQELQLPPEISGKLSFEHGLNLLAALEDRANRPSPIPASQVEVLWDKESQAQLRSLGTLSTSNVRVSIQQKRDWFQLDGVCEMDSGSFDLSELIESLAGEGQMNVGGFIRIGDKGWAKVTEELKSGLKKLADSVNVERGKMKFDRTAAVAMRDVQTHLKVDSTRSWKDCLDRLATAETLEPVVPAELQADLRDYQVDGFKWMRRLAEWGVGGVLADDMGLGKTVQTLAVLVDRSNLGPALVIAPTSVGFNWLRELARFAPHLQAHSYRETDRGEFLNELGPGHIVVCSYGLALRDAEKLNTVAWSSLVLDEAQAIKNSQSKTSQAIANIASDWTIALTGTPVENHLGELWSLFRVVSPGLFGGWENFRNRFATPIERNNDDERRQALRERLKPFVLRRTKKEVLTDLPARTESNQLVEMTPAERKMYDRVRMSVIGEASQIAGLDDVKDQRFKLLALLTRLRQIACHPRLVDENWKERSTKLLQLLETLQQLRSEGHRALIFSQFVQHLRLIREMLDEEGISYQYLDGSTTPNERQTQVDRFQNGDATAFLISLKAGGTGLNLTAADYVIHMDPWWNPAVEDQATDRAHRIGQTKPVMVYRLITKNTVEEEILKLHEDKRDLVAGILDGTHAASSLSTKELVDLLTRQS